MIEKGFAGKTAGCSQPAVFRLCTQLAVSLAVLLAFAGCGAEAEKPGRDTYVIEGSTFGTYYVIKIVEGPTGPLDEKQLDGLRQDIESELADVDAKISSYRADSEVSRFNAAGEQPFQFSEETFEVLQAALEQAAKSGGAFDPTVGPLAEAWGFGPHGRKGQESLSEEARRAAVEAARPLVGWSKLEIDAAKHEARKTLPGMHLDLSAIGEGHAIDRLSLFLAGRGYADVLVELGGEARARGRNADGGKWRIGIERPSLQRGNVQHIIELDDEAISTSGDYRKYYEKDGERISHLLDPRRGRTIDHKLASVSVIAKTCRLADSWATSLMVLGPEEGFALAEAENLSALFLVRKGEGFAEKPTAAFVSAFPSAYESPRGNSP